MSRPTTTVLSPRERMVCASYADGWPIKQVATAIGLSTETAKTYVKRAREKYALQGRDASTKIKLGLCIEQDLRAELPAAVFAVDDLEEGAA